MEDVLSITYQERFKFRGDEYPTVVNCFYSIVDGSYKSAIRNLRTDKLLKLRLCDKYFEVFDDNEIYSIVAGIILAKCKQCKNYASALRNTRGLLFAGVEDNYLGGRNNAYGNMLAYVRDMGAIGKEFNSNKVNELGERFKEYVQKMKDKERELKKVKKEKAWEKYYKTHEEDFVPLEAKYIVPKPKKGVIDAGEFID